MSHGWAEELSEPRAESEVDDTDAGCLATDATVFGEATVATVACAGCFRSYQLKMELACSNIQHEYHVMHCTFMLSHGRIIAM